MRALFCCVCLVAASGVATAGDALDKPSFTATGAELLAAAKAAPANDVVVLREEHDIAFDEHGAAKTRWRFVVVLRTQSAADNWQTGGTYYNAAREERPVLRLRIVDPSGTSTEIDPALVVDTPSTEEGSREHDVTIKLPRLAPGTVLEQEILSTDHASVAGTGYAHYASVGDDHAPTVSTRITISAPDKLPLHFALYGLGKRQLGRTSRRGRSVWQLDVGSWPERTPRERATPGDVRSWPSVAVSPVASWSAIARDVGAAIDKAIADGPAPMPAKLQGATTPTLASVRTITHWVHGMLAWRGVAINDTAIAPATPAQILQTGRADALDKATLLVALLRLAGVHADVALVASRPSLDADTTLPSVTAFDHAIVRAVVDGKTVWIDTLESFGAVGQLSTTTQGRKALVIASDTKDLVTLPAQGSKDNVVTDRRTYTISENGYGTVREVSTETGVFEANTRDYYWDTKPDKVRESFAKYVSSRFAGAALASYSTTPPQDLDTPFEVKLEATRTGRAYTSRDAANIYLFPSDALDHVSELISDDDDEGDAGPRTRDFEVVRPHRRIVESRLVIPAGFAVPAPQPVRTVALGPMTYTESQRVDGHDLVVTFELDTGKTRWTPAEFTAARKAVRDLEAEGVRHLMFENIGSSHLLAGRMREALAEVQRMIKLHPKEGGHYAELARVYIQVGAGDAARKAARKAVELEPKKADLYVVLGWVLGHDELGRQYLGSFDRAGARAALEKARSLDPKHYGAAHELAMMLERDGKGHRFDAGADLAGAAAAWKAVYDLEPTEEAAESYMRALLWSDRAAEAAAFGRGLAANEKRNILLVAAIAASTGGAEAIREAGALATGADRKKLLEGAASILYLTRNYDGMRAIYAEQRSLDASSTRGKLVAKLRRIDKTFKPDNTPAGAVIELFLAAAAGRTSTVYWDAATEAELNRDPENTMASFAATREYMTSFVLSDTLVAMFEPHVDGDAHVWRAEASIDSKRLIFYGATRKGQPRIVGSMSELEGVGRHVLRLLADNDEASAQRLLDWAVQDNPRSSKVSFKAQLLRALWGGTLPRTRQAAELAGAVLAGNTDADRALPIAQKCGATTVEGQGACDVIVTQILGDKERWPELLAHIEQWMPRAKGQIVAVMRASALTELGRLDGADRQLDEVLAKEPNDRSALAERAKVALARGHLDDAITAERTLVDAPTSTPTDSNNLAWLELYAGKDLKDALATIQKAYDQAADRPSLLHTLASLEAANGDVAQAWTHGLEYIAARHHDAEPAVRFLRGLIFEQLGMRDEAIAEYRKAKRKGRVPRGIPDSPEFAARRLAALGVKP